MNLITSEAKHKGEKGEFEILQKWKALSEPAQQ